MFQTIINYLIHFFELWLVIRGIIIFFYIYTFGIQIVCAIFMDIWCYDVCLEIVGITNIIGLDLLTLLLVLR